MKLVSQQRLIRPADETKQQIARSGSRPASARLFQGKIHPLIRQLQQMLGNHRVAQLIHAKRLTPQGKILGLQPKLTGGAANDQYEQEGDRVASDVMTTTHAVAANPMRRAISPKEKKRRDLSSSSLTRKCLLGYTLATPLKQPPRVAEHANTENKLPAHESIHVLQQGQTDKLYGKSYLEEQNISAATTVGKASEVAKIVLGTLSNPSGKIYPYIKDKMKTLTDKLSGMSIDDPAVFGHKYKKINDIKDPAVKEEKVFQTIGGFIDPKKDDIYLHLRSNYCHAVHEAIHTISFHDTFSKSFGHELMEGMTQYFTDVVFEEQTGEACKTHNYAKELACASFFVDQVDFDTTAKVFFSNKYNLLAPAFRKLKVKTVGELKNYILKGC